MCMQLFPVPCEMFDVRRFRFMITFADQNCKGCATDFFNSCTFSIQGCDFDGKCCRFIVSFADQNCKGCATYLVNSSTFPIQEKRDVWKSTLPPGHVHIRGVCPIRQCSYQYNEIAMVTTTNHLLVFLQ